MACIAVYCSRELFPIPVTYVYIIYGYSLQCGFNDAQLVHSSSFPTNSAPRASMYDRGSILKQASFSKNRCCTPKWRPFLINFVRVTSRENAL